MWEKIKAWLEIRIGERTFTRTVMHEYRLPKDTGFLGTFGLVAMAALIVQTITGVLLLMYYMPHPDHAFRSVQIIMTKVSFGWLFRMLHLTSANVMIATVLIHTIYVFYKGSFRMPRELTWLSGAVLLFLTLTLSVTGYILPWHQLSYWTTTVLTTIPTVLPFLDWIAQFVRGGEFVSNVTLSRFFGFHVAILPALVLVFVTIHAFLVIRIGFSPSKDVETAVDHSSEFKSESYPDGMPFYPNYLLKALSMVMLFFVVVFFLITFMPSLFLPPLANVEADPLMTPEVIRPQWFFLAPYKLMNLIPNKFLGISLNIFFTVLFFALPFVGRKDGQPLLTGAALRGTFYGVMALWLILTIWGAL